MLKAMLLVGDKLPFHKFLLRLKTHRTIPAPVSCVVVAIARNCASTSIVFCRNIDNIGSGEGEPFQLRKLENRSLWKNEEVTNEGLKVGCLLEYRVVRRRCKLGEGDEEQFIFHRIAGTELQDVDKILLDLQDDESVHEGLKEALEYYNRKDVLDKILKYKSLLNAHGELLIEARECSNPEDVLDKILKYRSLLNARVELLREARKGSNPEDVLDKLPKYESLLNAHWQVLKEACECLNPEDVLDELPKYKYLLNAHREVLKEACEGFNPEDVWKNLLNFYRSLRACHEFLGKGSKCLNPEDAIGKQQKYIHVLYTFAELLKEAREHLNPKFQGLQAHLACTRIFFLGIRAGMINNERVTLETMNGEWLEMPLNCRESLVLSTGPVHLQLNRPWDVADDDVGGVAVVKYEAGEATCEGLILRYKPFIISRVEEPVQIQNACGKVIPVPGHYRVLFDTGNEVATSISRELLLELNLQPVLNKKMKVKLAGRGSGQFEEVEIKLIIRGYPFKVWALVDAAAEGTDLLLHSEAV